MTNSTKDPKSKRYPWGLWTKNKKDIEANMSHDDQMKMFRELIIKADAGDELAERALKANKKLYEMEKQLLENRRIEAEIAHHHLTRFEKRCLLVFGGVSTTILVIDADIAPKNRTI